MYDPISVNFDPVLWRRVPIYESFFFQAILAPSNISQRHVLRIFIGKLDDMPLWTVNAFKGNIKKVLVPPFPETSNTNSKYLYLLTVMSIQLLMRREVLVQPFRPVHGIEVRNDVNYIKVIP